MPKIDKPNLIDFIQKTQKNRKTQSTALRVYEDKFFFKICVQTHLLVLGADPSLIKINF